MSERDIQLGVPANVLERTFGFSTSVFALQRVMILTVCFLVVPPGGNGIPPANSSATKSEHILKAVLLFNLIKFVHWPHADSGKSRAALQVYVIGSHSMYKTLQDIEGSSHNHCVLTFLPSERDLSQIADNSVVYLSRDFSQHLKGILNHVQGLPILLVGEGPGFIDHGGMIGLVRRQKKIAFEINRQAMNSVGLDVSSRVLRLALKVIPYAS